MLSKLALDTAIELLKDQIEFCVKHLYYDDDEYAKDRINDLQVSHGELVNYRKQAYGVQHGR